MKNSKGMTLIELMVVIVIMLICLMAVYNIFIAQQKAYVREGAITEAQEVGQQLLNMLRKDIIMAGYGVDKKLAIYIEDGGNSNADRLYVNDWEFIDDNELLNGIYGQTSFAGPTSSLSSVTHDLDNDGTDDIKDYISGNNAQRVITDYVGANSETHKVARIASSGSDNYALKKANGANTSVSIKGSYVAPAIYYEVYYNASTKTYYLRRSDKSSGGCQPLADNVVDMQIAYKDKNGNWYCDGTNTCPMNPFNPENIALLRVSIVMRTSKKTSKTSNTGRPSIENRIAGPADEYTYRVYTTEIAPRNLLF